MKKTIIALILIIPLIFLFTVFSAGNVASIGVEIAVTGIEILNKPADETLTLDLAGENSFTVSAGVLPRRAKNQDYRVTVQPVDEETPLADIHADEKGKLTAKGVGKARITAISNDGGFTDSFVAVVISSKPVGFSLVVTDETGGEVELEEGADGVLRAQVTSGKYFAESVVYPSGMQSGVRIEDNGNAEGAVRIRQSDNSFQLMFSGETSLKFVLDEGASGPVEREVRFSVRQMSTQSGITVNGGSNTVLAAADETASLDCYLELGEELSGEPAILRGEEYLIEDGQPRFTPLSTARSETRRYRLRLAFAPRETLPDNMEFEIGAGGNANYKLSVNFFNFANDFAFSVRTSLSVQPDYAEVCLPAGEGVSFYALPAVEAEGVTYRWECSDASVLVWTSADGGECRVTAPDSCSFVLTAAAYLHGHEANFKHIELRCTSVGKVTAMQFSNRTDLGLARSLAVADRRLEGGVEVENKYELRLKTFEKGVFSDYEPGQVRFSSSDESIATVVESENSVFLRIHKTGFVTLRAEWIYNQNFGTEVRASLPLQAVKGGLEVSNAPDLMAAAESGRTVVLTDDISLGTDRKGSLLSASERIAMAKTMPTTYNNQFCLNTGRAAEIRYLLEFKADLYGNGFGIDAENLTTLTDSTGSVGLVFHDPLPFAAVLTAQVFAQDNAVFLLRTEGVTLYNAVLSGCTDEYLENADGVYDLTRLNRTGTTVEVNASVSLLNCRVKNGRNALRVYGGNRSGGQYFVERSFSASAERIEVLVEGCVISQAREFLVKVGANHALPWTTGANPPALTRADGSPYPTQTNDYLDDPYFYDRYVLTDLTLRDSVLMTSGLFSVGVEANFEGPFLAYEGAVEGIEFKFPEWEHIAGTSYASVLRLAGDVRLYDWKNLDNVDSSTLIQTSGDFASYLRLDIRAMLEKIYRSDREEFLRYKNLLAEREDGIYVHGGVAFYGGGNNYAQLDLTGLDERLSDLAAYPVNISILAQDEPSGSDLAMQGTVLPLAAGFEDFRFFLYDKESGNSLEGQRADFSDGSAFSGILPLKIPS